jgi:hypothetical protein
MRVVVVALVACGSRDVPPPPPEALELAPEVIDAYGGPRPDTSIVISSGGGGYRPGATRSKDYTIEVRGTGEVIFNGIANVDRLGPHVVRTLPREEVAHLLDDLAAAHVLTHGDNRCATHGADAPTTIVELTHAGHHNKVFDDHNCGGDPELDRLRPTEMKLWALVDMREWAVDSSEPPPPPPPGRPSVSIGAPAGVKVTAPEAELVERVVRSRAGIYRACYQKELNHAPGLSGKLTVRFTIADGAVTMASASGLGNSEVETCIARNIRTLKFPTNAVPGTYSYPFTFSRGEP